MIYCPLKSSSAVYKAGGMYGIVEPFTRFDNYSICDSQGMQYRLAQLRSEVAVIELNSLEGLAKTLNHGRNIQRFSASSKEQTFQQLRF